MHKALTEDREDNRKLLVIAGELYDEAATQPELVKLWEEFCVQMPTAYDHPLDYSFLLGWHAASINGLNLFKEACNEMPAHREQFLLHMAAIAGMDQFVLDRLEELSVEG